MGPTSVCSTHCKDLFDGVSGLYMGFGAISVAALVLKMVTKTSLKILKIDIREHNIIITMLAPESPWNS